MMASRRTFAVLVAAVLFGAALATPAAAQVGKGLLDPNVASEQELTALPHMTAAIVKGLVANRPFASIVALNTFLTQQGLTAQQTAELYRKAFIHVNLNTGTAEEILLIPGAGKRMAHEFDEYRPWKSWAQFDKEIGKYVDQAEVDRLKQYVFIPLNLNTASDADFLTIPGVGARMVHEFNEYRPWKTQAQFEKEIGKYVDEKEVARLWRYMTID
jgi:DNA uptake protein ComE-like DNA-binding protein